MVWTAILYALAMVYSYQPVQIILPLMYTEIQRLPVKGYSLPLKHALCLLPVTNDSYKTVIICLIKKVFLTFFSVKFLFLVCFIHIHILLHILNRKLSFSCYLQCFFSLFQLICTLHEEDKAIDATYLTDEEDWDKVSCITFCTLLSSSISYTSLIYVFFFLLYSCSKYRTSKQLHVYGKMWQYLPTLQCTFLVRWKS